MAKTTGDTLFEQPMQDAPHDLVTAVSEALTVLSWFENLPDDEQPPRHIWWSDELLTEWFRNVKQKRKEGSSKRGARTSFQEADDVPMNQNTLIDRSGPVPKLVKPEEPES